MFAEFDKVVRCLALELPESVHADVVAKYGKLKTEVEKFTSTNNGSTPCRFFSREKLCAGQSNDGCTAYQSVPWCNHEPSQRAVP
jgi:hypothetical protein